MEVVRTTTLGGGVEVEVSVTNVTAPLSSVDDASSVTTTGGGVLVTRKVVGEKDVTDDSWEELCDEDLEDELVVRRVGEEIELVEEQLAKTVEIGLASVMMLVMTSGTDIVETPPMQSSI